MQQVTVHPFRSSASFTRPADTTAYTAQDVVGPATTPALLEFNGINPQPGPALFEVKTARIVTNLSTCTATFRLYLYHTSVTPIADNSPWTLLDANKAKRLGWIDFAACSTAGTGSDSASSLWGPTDGSFTGITASDNGKVYGVLVATSGFTPASGQTFTVELIGAGY